MAKKRESELVDSMPQLSREERAELTVVLKDAVRALRKTA